MVKALAVRYGTQSSKPARVTPKAVKTGTNCCLALCVLVWKGGVGREEQCSRSAHTGVKIVQLCSLELWRNDGAHTSQSELQKAFGSGSSHTPSVQFGTLILWRHYLGFARLTIKRNIPLDSSPGFRNSELQDIEYTPESVRVDVRSERRI